MNIFNYMSYYWFGLAKTRFLDYAAMFVYGKAPTNLAQVIFAQITQIVFAGFLGIILSYAFTYVTSENYLFKGWVFGIMCWFFIYAAGLIFNLPLLEKVALTTAISNFIGSSIYGIVSSKVLKHLDLSIR